jgi:predicted NAD/FAD-binding protein
MTMGEYLKYRGYSNTFLRNYVLPMCAAVWSVPEAQVAIGVMLEASK